MLMAMRAPACALLLVIVLALAACGGSSTTTTTNASGKVVVSCHIRFAKTKFALHAGIAAAAFYRYIYKPYRAGAFKSGAPGRRKALVKAGATAVFAAHELRVAARNARCDGPALKRVADPLAAVLAPLDSLHGLSTGGGLGEIATAQAALSRLSTASTGAGVPVPGGSG
jgi:hypothetical protein